MEGTTVPHELAELEARLTLDAVVFAAESLLAVSEASLSPKVSAGALEALLTLREMCRDAYNTLERVNVMLDIIEKRLTALG